MTDIMKMGKNPNYLGSWDLEDEPNRILTLTIASIADEEVVSAGQKEVCTVMRFSEPYKPMIMNVTNKKRLARLYKTKYTENLVGKRITIVIEKVKAFGDVYDALRIAQQIPPEPKKIPCEECGGNINPASGMSSEQVAAYTKAKYGKCLCADCARKAAAVKKEAEQ